MSEALIKEALRVAQDLDLAVFPVSSSKRPIIKGWQSKATRDPDEIRRLFSMGGAAGIGVPCGPENNIICFDIDIGHTDDKDRLTKLLDWKDFWSEVHDDPVDEPPFMLRQTRSGGYHMLFAWPEGERPPRRIMPKLDVIIDGFYFVWWMEDGSYKHLQGELTDLQPTPEMLKVVERATGSGGGSLVSAEEADEILRSDGDQGMRHDAILRLAWDWCMDNPTLSRVELASSLEDWIRDIYGAFIEPERLDALVEWDKGDDYGGELWRALDKPVSLRPVDDDTLARVGAKLKDRGFTLPSPKIEDDTPKEEPATRRAIEFEDQLFDIPPRQWMLGSYLLRGKVTTMSAPGGTGKSVLALLWAAMLASGEHLLGPAPHHRSKVLVWSGEDDIVEMRRRLQAILLRHEIDVVAHLAMETQQMRDLRLVTKDEKGRIVIHKSKVDAMIDDLKSAGVEVLILDPLISMHGLNENDNAEMDLLMDQLIRIAEEASVAVLAIHHVAKGSMRDDRRGDPADAARGATAIVNRARVALALRVMTSDEAVKAQIDEARRFSYVQVIDAKANLSTRSGYGSSDWFQLVSHPLGNETDDYPQGDMIGVPVRYDVGALLVTDLEAFAIVVDAMETETALPPGERRNKAHPSNAHWIGNLIGAVCQLDWGEYSNAEMRTGAQQAAYQRAQEIITAMVSAGLLLKNDVPDAARKMKPGYVLAKRAASRIQVLRDGLV